MIIPSAAVAFLAAVLAPAASAQSTERKPTIHWGVDVGEHGTMSDGNGITATDEYLFVSNSDCSLVTMNRTDGSVLSVYKFEDPDEGETNQLLCSTVPLVYRSSDGSDEFVVYASRRGHVVAVDFDGTPRWNATVGGGGVENLRVERQGNAIIAAHNEGNDGTITFVNPTDGSVYEDLRRTVVNDTITGLSASGSVGGSYGWSHFVTGLNTANLYRLSLGDMSPNEVVMEDMARLGKPGPNSLPFPPTISSSNVPIVKQFVPSANGEWLYALLTEYDEYDYRKNDPSELSSNFASPPLLVEGVGGDATANMICWGWNNYNCVDRETGCPVWSRVSIMDGISGDPNVWVSSGSSDDQQTILLDALRLGTLYSLNPETGEDVWVLSCSDYRDQVGYQCTPGIMTEGRGAMAVSPDRDLVYFSPAPGWIMAADIFLQPEPAPEPGVPTASPTKPPVTAGEPMTPSPTPAGDGGSPTTEAPTSAPTETPTEEPTEVPSAASCLVSSFLGSAVAVATLLGIL